MHRESLHSYNQWEVGKTLSLTHIYYSPEPLESRILGSVSSLQLFNNTADVFTEYSGWSWVAKSTVAASVWG